MRGDFLNEIAVGVVDVGGVADLRVLIEIIGRVIGYRAAVGDSDAISQRVVFVLDVPTIGRSPGDKLPEVVVLVLPCAVHGGQRTAPTAVVVSVIEL